MPELYNITVSAMSLNMQEVGGERCQTLRHLHVCARSIQDNNTLLKRNQIYFSD